MNSVRSSSHGTTARPPEDLITVATAAAALQLLPANASRLLRLRRLAAMAAAGAVSSPRPPTPSWLRAQLASAPVGGEGIAAQDDRYDDVMTKEIAYAGGPFLVMQGGVSGSADLLQGLLEVLQVRRDQLPQPFVIEMRKFARVLLALSDVVCRRAGLTRHSLPGLATRLTPDVPSAGTLRGLEACVTFSTNDLAALLPGSCVPTVQGLAIQPGELVWDHQRELSPDPHVSTPLLWTPDGLVVASPTELATTFRHRLFGAAGRYGCLDDVATALEERAQARVELALAQLGYRPNGQSWETATSGVASRNFTQDRVPEARVVVVADMLNGYDDNELFTEWATSQTQTDLALDLLDDPAAAADDQPQDAMRLIVDAGVGRNAVFGLRDLVLCTPLLQVQLADLETLTDLPSFDAASLWFFARAESELHDRSRVLSFNLLDNYASFREHEHSYYLGDDRPPTMVVFEAADGRVIRQDAATRRDRHRRADPADMLVPLISLHGVEVAPLYFTDPAYAPGVQVAELGSYAAWVTPAQTESSHLTSFLRDIAEAFAYWIWQAATALPGWLESWPDNILDCRIEGDDRSSWTDLLSGRTSTPLAGRDEPFMVARLEGRTLQVTARYAAAARLLDPSNLIDRDIVKVLVDALSDSDLDADGAVDRVVPAGTKRMLHVVNPSMVVHQPGELPRSRPRRDEASSIALDLAAGWLAGSRWPQGAVADTDRCALINDIVAFYYETLAARVATFEPASLLRYLIALNEALLHSEARREHFLPSRVAAFGEGAAPVERLLEEQSRATSSSVASRFLIEYVAACPPSGDRIMSAIDYDLLLAIASEIVSRGQLSDAIRHQFADVTVSVLASGRLGVSREGAYTLASEAHGLAFVATRRREILSPDDGLTGSDDTDEARGADPNASAGAVDTAMREEFGFTHDELANVLVELIALCNERPEPAEMPVDTVISALAATLGLAPEHVQVCLSHLELTPREDFLKPAREVMPWLYTRDLSYVRRPLIRVATEAGDSFVFARRRLWQTHSYWLQLIHMGRLRGRTRTMKRLLGGFRQVENRDFELQVVRTLEQAGYNPSLHAVSRIEGRRLSDADHNDLGDIDALGIHERSRVILIAEAKDFQMGRTAPELAHEADTLLRDPNSALVKLKRRAQWVRRNTQTVLKHAEVQADSRGWEVKPVIVTSRDLLSARILTSDVPVVDISQLAEWAAAAAGRTPRRRH